MSSLLPVTLALSLTSTKEERALRSRLYVSWSHSRYVTMRFEYLAKVHPGRAVHHMMADSRLSKGVPMILVCLTELARANINLECGAQ